MPIMEATLITSITLRPMLTRVTTKVSRAWSMCRAVNSAASRPVRRLMIHQPIHRVIRASTTLPQYCRITGSQAMKAVSR